MTMWRMKYAKTLITFVVLLPLLFYFLVTRLDISPEKIGVRQDVSVEYREAGYQSNRVHDHQMVVENPVLQEPSHNVEYKEQDKDVVYHEEQDKAAANHEEPTIESQVRTHAASTWHSPDVGIMLGQRRRRWANIVTTLGERFVFVGPYSKHETFTLCWYNVGPASQTVGKHCNNIGWTFRVCGAMQSTWYIKPTSA